MKKRSLATILISGALSAFPPLAQPLSPAALSARVEQAEARLMKMRSALGLGEQHTFVMKRSTQDALGQVHARFSQYYKGVRVWAAILILTLDARCRPE